MRAASAIDIALWDLCGQASRPAAARAARRCVRATRSAPTTRAPGTATSATSNEPGSRQLGPAGRTPAEGPYEDLDAFLHRADELARDLLAQGITGDEDLAVRPVRRGESGGHDISTADLDRALEPFRKIRAAVGPAMDVMVELHALWDVPAACRIVGALERVRPVLDRGSGARREPGRARRGAARDERRRSPSARRSRAWRRSATCSRAAARRSSIFDVGWVGGITEARKVAALAEAFERPVAPHDCTGPVVYTAATHLSMHAAERDRCRSSVRAFCERLVRASS